MSWMSDDGEHEGWATAEFPDGRVDVGSSADGVYLRTIEEAISGTGGQDIPDTADGRTAIGWRGLCTCGWQGPLWRRVPAEPSADPARRLVYWADANKYAEPPKATEDAIGDEWRAHLPSPAVTDIRAAAAAARRADDALDDAVRRARLDGTTWAVIGDAAGMTRQAANERWGKRFSGGNR